MRVAALILAAGAGVRLGAAVPKALIDVGGQSLVARSAASFAAHPGIAQIVVVAPPARLDEVRAMVPSQAAVVPGGQTRQSSVRAGLEAIFPDADAVLIHDSARAFTPAAVLDRVLHALGAGAGAVIPVLPLPDAVKRVDVDGAVRETLDRSSLRLVQTPQGFRRALIVAAHQAALERGDEDAVDDASLVEALGEPVLTVAGDARAFKITVPTDLLRAAVLDG